MRHSYNINLLSAARVFLFGARDAWFEVPLPFFLRNADVGLGWTRSITGLFLAVFIIVYGQFQSWSPQLILGPLRQAPANKSVAMLWAAILALLPTVLGPVILLSDAFQEHQVENMTAILVVRRRQCFATPGTARALRQPSFAISSAAHPAAYIVARPSSCPGILARQIGHSQLVRAGRPRVLLRRLRRQLRRALVSGASLRGGQQGRRQCTRPEKAVVRTRMRTPSSAFADVLCMMKAKGRGVCSRRTQAALKVPYVLAGFGRSQPPFACAQVGFYYMANAVGRLTGTLLSGVLYTYAGSSPVDGFGWCFVLSACFLVACVALTRLIRDDADGLACGAFWIIRRPLPTLPTSENAAGNDDTKAVCALSYQMISLWRSEVGSLRCGSVVRMSGAAAALPCATVTIVCLNLQDATVPPSAARLTSLPEAVGPGDELEQEGAAASATRASSQQSEEIPFERTVPHERDEAALAAANSHEPSHAG